MLIHNAIITGSLLVNGTGHNTGSFSGSFIGAVVGGATTGSNNFNGSQAITGSLTVTGQVVAQTLNVQQVTSSIVYSSGSNVFGNSVSNTQQFTGSLQISGSSHYVLGSVGIGTTSPGQALDVYRDTSTASYVVARNGSGVQVAMGAAGDNGSLLGTLSNHNLRIVTNGAVVATVTNGGNAGIGTSSPIVRLQVQDSANTYVSHFSGLNQTNGIALGTNSSNVAVIQGYTRTFGGANNIAMQVDGGNISIGATSTNGRLGVRGTTNDSSAYSFEAANSSGNSLFLVRNDGNVGVGPSSPTVRFQAEATINSTYSPSDTLNGGVIAYIKNTTTTNATDATIRLETVGSSNVAAASISAVHVGAGSSDLTFGTRLSASNVTERVRITAAGTVQPGANGTQDLGTSSLRWATVYTSDLSLSNGIGDYTIVEGEHDLFLYNNKNNKVYKFLVEEVDPSTATPKKS